MNKLPTFFECERCCGEKDKAKQNPVKEASVQLNIQKLVQFMKLLTGSLLLRLKKGFRIIV